jgi:hypothetical protein
MAALILTLLPFVATFTAAALSPADTGRQADACRAC